MARFKWGYGKTYGWVFLLLYYRSSFTFQYNIGFTSNFGPEDLSLVCLYFKNIISLFPRTHMQNIKDITSSIHFEAYRVKRLNESQNALSNGVVDKEELVANEM